MTVRVVGGQRREWSVSIEAVSKGFLEEREFEVGEVGQDLNKWRRNCRPFLAKGKV